MALSKPSVQTEISHGFSSSLAQVFLRWHSTLFMTWPENLPIITTQSRCNVVLYIVFFFNYNIVFNPNPGIGLTGWSLRHFGCHDIFYKHPRMNPTGLPRRTFYEHLQHLAQIGGAQTITPIKLKNDPLEFSPRTTTRFTLVLLMKGLHTFEWIALPFDTHIYPFRRIATTLDE